MGPLLFLKDGIVSYYLHDGTHFYLADLSHYRQCLITDWLPCLEQNMQQWY